MVRGPAAVLGLLAAAQAYVLVAPGLPVITPVDLSIVIACACGAAAVLVCIAGLTPVSDVPAMQWLIAAGALLLVIGLNAANVGAAATPIEAVAYGVIGGIFAVGLLAPSLAVALPIFVAAIDAVSTFAGGTSEALARGATHAGDALSLEFPDWGTGLAAGRIGISDAVFAGVFLVYARRLGLRPRATAVGLWVAIVAAVGIRLAWDHAVPVLPLMAIAYFAVNLDRIPTLLREAGRG